METGKSNFYPHQRPPYRRGTRLPVRRHLRANRFGSQQRSFRDKLETTPAGEIKIDAFCRTTLPGVYAAGDVSNVPYKQIAIAMGEGAKAALSAFDDRIRGVI